MLIPIFVRDYAFWTVGRMPAPILQEYKNKIENVMCKDTPVNK